MSEYRFRFYVVLCLAIIAGMVCIMTGAIVAKAHDASPPLTPSVEENPEKFRTAQWYLGNNATCCDEPCTDVVRMEIDEQGKYCLRHQLVGANLCTDGWSECSSPPVAVPEPSANLLLLTGLVGLVGVGRKR